MARVLGILRGLKRGQHANKHKKIKNLGLSRIEKCTFPSGIYSFPMDPMDSIGTTFYPSSNTEWNFPKSLTNRRNELFHWNLFVSNGSPTLGRTFHHYTSGFPMESKGIRLESSQRVLDNSQKGRKRRSSPESWKTIPKGTRVSFVLSSFYLHERDTTN